MDLMKYPPKSVLVSESVPPVEDKSADKPTDKTLCEWKLQARKPHKRGATKKLNPELPGSQGNAQLRKID